MRPQAVDFSKKRNEMVRRDIERRGVRDSAVLNAMRTVPRELFVPERLVRQAYDDRPLRIGKGQTISQPFIVATMAAAAEITPQSRVLEVGTGSGYGAAILSRLADEVWTVERHESLAATAEQRLSTLGYENAHVVRGDGSIGLASMAPFDAIVVTAAAARVPTDLIDQLREGGVLVAPVGPQGSAQRLLHIRRVGGEPVERDIGRVSFVPLVSSARENPEQS